MSLEDKLSQLLNEQRIINQTIEAIYSEVILLQKALEERRGAKLFLERYKNIEGIVAETLFPIGGGVYVEGNLPIKKKFYVHVGANIYLLKEIDEALTYVDNAIKELEKALNERNKALMELKSRYDELTAEIGELYMKLQGR
jgi:prefoldin alpha subunit